MRLPKLSKFETEGREFVKYLRSLEEFIPTVYNNFWYRTLYYLIPGGFLDVIDYLEKLEFKLEKITGI